MLKRTSMLEESQESKEKDIFNTDKLVIESVLHGVDDFSKLPSDFQKKSSYPTSGKVIVFYGINPAYSNFYTSKL